MKYTLKQVNKALSLFDQIENATLVCRQLGYPSVSVLYLWIRKRRRNNGVFPDFESRLKHKVSSTPQVSTYSVEDKLKILKRCFEGAEFVRDVADELNITTATIYKWRRILLRKGVAGLIAKPSKKIKRDRGSIAKAAAESENISSETAAKTSENEQIKALKKEIEELHLKVDVMTEVLNVLKKHHDRAVITSAV